MSLLLGASALAAPAGKKSAVEGTIRALRGKVLTINLKPKATPPPTGAACTVLRHFTKNLGFIKTQGWLEIAEATVKTSGARLKLVVTKKKSEMKVNGKPVDHFRPGTRARVTWTGP